MGASSGRVEERALGMVAEDMGGEVCRAWP